MSHAELTFPVPPIGPSSRPAGWIALILFPLIGYALANLFLALIVAGGNLFRPGQTYALLDAGVTCLVIGAITFRQPWGWVLGSRIIQIVLPLLPILMILGFAEFYWTPGFLADLSIAVLIVLPTTQRWARVTPEVAIYVWRTAWRTMFITLMLVYGGYTVMMLLYHQQS